MWDIDPIQTGHLLIISKDHFTSLAELSLPVLHELAELEQKITILMEQHRPINGVTLARNDKELMDTGTHSHSHLIPRRKDDGFWDTIKLPLLSHSLSTFEQSMRSL